MAYKYNRKNDEFCYRTSEFSETSRYNLRHADKNMYSARRRNQARRKAQRKAKFTKGLVIFVIALAVVICATLLISSLNKRNTKPEDTQNPSVATTPTEEVVEKISYSKTENTVDFPKTSDAEYGIIVDKTTNTIVAERKIHKRVYPASTTKIMTLLVAVENIKDINDTFTMTYEITDPLYIAQASVAGFKNDEKICMTDLLYGTILPSGADAATGLAIKVAGSEENFVKLMNDKVKELELENTHFNNVTGLHHEENYSSVYDMAVILDAALQNDLCKEILSTYQHTTAKTPQNPDGLLLSSTLFNYMYGTEPETATILGGKTGYTTEAGYCIASYGKANANNNEYIIVTFDSPGLWPAFNGQIDLYKQFAK